MRRNPIPSKNRKKKGWVLQLKKLKLTQWDEDLKPQSRQRLLRSILRGLKAMIIDLRSFRVQERGNEDKKDGLGILDHLSESIMHSGGYELITCCRKMEGY